MKAWTKHKYGGPDVLQLEEIDKPKPKDGQLLVRIKANSANPADWHILRGDPFFARFSTGLFKPKEKVLGADFAAVVEELGEGVTHFKPGDHVFGESMETGVFAEYACIPANICAKMPASPDFPEMAGVPIAGLTALQALITHGKIKAGETVLINGASGGVGHFAVQIAKAYGAGVTGVCSASKRDFVRSLGADQVIAYDEKDIHSHEGNYDLVIDVHGNLHHSDFRRMGKRGILVGFTGLGHMFAVLAANVFRKFPFKIFTAEPNTNDLQTLADLVEKGKVKTHIDKMYTYREIPDAIAFIEEMRTRGKVVMVWEEDEEE